MRTAVLVLLVAALTAPAGAEPPAQATPAGRLALADELDAYLVKHVLAPRYPAAVDRERGGFHAHFAPDWTRQEDHRRFVVYQARMTWTPAAVTLARPALRDEGGLSRLSDERAIETRQRKADRGAGGGGRLDPGHTTGLSGDNAMTRAEDLSRLSPTDRLRLLRFVTSIAWSDLAIRDGERAYVHRLVSRLHLTPGEALQVEGWLKLPPSEDEVDPTTIPHEHRTLFLDAVREMLAADGNASPEERETLSLLEQLTR